MPAPYVKKVASKLGIPLDQAETYWKKSKALSKRKSGPKNNWAYTVGIFKHMTKQSSKKSHKESGVTTSPSSLVESFLSEGVDCYSKLNWSNNEKLFPNYYDRVYSPIEAKDLLRRMSIRFSSEKMVTTGVYAYSTDQGQQVAYYDNMQGRLFLNKDLSSMQPLAVLNQKFPTGGMKTLDPSNKLYY